MPNFVYDTLDDQAVCHGLPEEGSTTVEVGVYVSVRDENGKLWKAERFVKMRLKPETK